VFVQANTKRPANAGLFDIWCGRGDLNSYDPKARQPLKPVRLLFLTIKVGIESLSKTCQDLTIKWACLTMISGPYDSHSPIHRNHRQALRRQTQAGTPQWRDAHLRAHLHAGQEHRQVYRGEGCSPPPPRSRPTGISNCATAPTRASICMAILSPRWPTPSSAMRTSFARCRRASVATTRQKWTLLKPHFEGVKNRRYRRPVPAHPAGNPLEGHHQERPAGETRHPEKGLRLHPA